MKCRHCKQTTALSPCEKCGKDFPTVSCSQCQRSQSATLTIRGEPKVPKGWKKKEDGLWCSDCQRGEYRIRAVMVPIAEVIEGGTWAEFMSLCYEAWRKASRVMNAATLAMAKAEEPLGVDPEAKLKPPPNINLYQCVKDFNSGSESQSIQCLARLAQQRYNAKRFEIYITSKSSIPVYGRLQPWPYHNKAWDIEVDKASGSVFVTFSLGGRRWKVALRAGAKHRGAVKDVLRILNEGLDRGELSILPKMLRSSSRGGVEGRESGGSQSKKYAPFLKFVAWYPKSVKPGEKTNVLNVRTCSESFLAYDLEGDDEIKRYYADHLKRWDKQAKRLKAKIEKHEIKKSRFSDDIKYEKRWSRPVRRTFVESQQAHNARHKRRVQTFLEETSAMVVGFAERNKCSEILYSDKDRSYADVPWAEFAALLERKAGDRNIKFTNLNKKDDSNGA